MARGSGVGARRHEWASSETGDRWLPPSGDGGERHPPWRGPSRRGPRLGGDVGEKPFRHYALTSSRIRQEAQPSPRETLEKGPGSQKAGSGQHHAEDGARSLSSSNGSHLGGADTAEVLPPSSGVTDSENSGADNTGEISAGSAAVGGSLLAVATVLAFVAGIGVLGTVYKDEINGLLEYFEEYIESVGPLGYVVFVIGYAVLEILAIPAIPLTMSAGLLFGTVTGTILVSISGTLAATGAFLIARYVARDRIMKLAKGNKKFLAIDKAIGKDSFRVVVLLRLSPLLPFSLGNYIYGLTSVELLPYIAGSWLGMLPGTWAYVSAGAFGKKVIQQDDGSPFSGGPELWTLGLGLLCTVAAALYVTNVAKGAIKEVEE
eukprot:SM000011S19047  [mRNA]  locus=s11:529794:533036:- [translate_table: standard]